ncbi:MAG: hypothetical protein WCY37_01955 [Candidatus Dojkabacteria bacterium]
MLDFLRRLSSILLRSFSFDLLFKALTFPSAILLILVNLLPIYGESRQEKSLLVYNLEE